MATRSKGSWEAETISEWQQSDSATWKAQFSTAPDGAKFAGVRQYIKTASKGEIAGKAGFSIKIDDDTADVLERMESLIKTLRASLNTKLSKSNARPKERNSRFVLYKEKTDRYLSVFGDGCNKVVSNIDKALVFKGDDLAEAKMFAETYPEWVLTKI
jgi:hypothetical protein